MDTALPLHGWSNTPGTGAGDRESGGPTSPVRVRPHLERGVVSLALCERNFACRPGEANEVPARRSPEWGEEASGRKALGRCGQRAHGLVPRWAFARRHHRAPSISISPTDSHGPSDLCERAERARSRGAFSAPGSRSAFSTRGAVFEVKSRKSTALEGRWRVFPTRRISQHPPFFEVNAHPESNARVHARPKYARRRRAFAVSRTSARTSSTVNEPMARLHRLWTTPRIRPVT